MSALRASTLLAYGLPGLPLAVLGLPLYVYLPVLYAKDVGLSLTVIGIVLLAARLFDTVIDPLVGIASDRFATRRGRRKPWIVAGVPLLSVSAWMLLVPAEQAGAGYLLAWSLFAYLGWTLIALPYTAMGAEISNDYHERSRLTAMREMFIIAGTLLAVIVPGYLEWQGTARADAMHTVAVMVIVMLPVCIGALLVVVGESSSTHTRPPGLRASWELLRNNLPFRRLLLAYLLNGIANGLPATLFLLFVAHALDAARWSGLFLVAYFLSGILALPAWLALSRRIGKKRTWLVSMVWASLVFASVPLLGSGDVIAFGVICVLSGLSLGVDQALPASMQADVVDADTAAGGGSSAGLYFGFWSMATKLALALAAGIAFPLLDALGFDPSASADESQNVAALVALYAALPVFFKLCAAAVIRKFPIDETRQRVLRTKIEQMTAGVTPC